MKLTKSNFENWLKAKSPRTKVGDRSDKGNPISKFARTNNISLDGMPKWAEQFTEKLRNTGSTYSSVSANAALNLL